MKKILVISLSLILAFALGYWAVSFWLARAADCNV